MEKYLNSGIKEVITQFPEIEAILQAYDIGCGPCMVGTCLLKDIVEIHQLPLDKEQEMMARIEKVVYPDREIQVPAATQPEKRTPHTITYSPPMKILVDEHVLIKRWLALIPNVTERLDLSSEIDRHVVAEGIDFIRSYADQRHHGKEEEILFNYFDDSAEIFNVIYEDHRQARAHATKMLAALDCRDTKVLCRHLTAYRSLLTEHIKKEDEILFPWLDQQLTMTQIGELFSKFQTADDDIKVDPLKYQSMINRLEAQFAERGKNNERILRVPGIKNDEF